MQMLISGITGQCGATAAKMALEQGFEVAGITRRTATASLGRLEEMGIEGSVRLIEGDIADTGNLCHIVEDVAPQVILNAAANSHVGESFHNPVANLRITGEGALNMLTAASKLDDEVIFFQFGSSEQFGSNFLWENSVYSADTGVGMNLLKGRSAYCFQNERTPFCANSPYAAAKIYAHNIADLYGRIHDNLKVYPMLFHNMEGPYRGSNFLTRKVTKYVGQLAHNPSMPPLELGNLEARRDWSHVEDSMAAIFHIIKTDQEPGSYMACSNNVHSVGDFCREAFSILNLDWNEYVTVNEKFFRPCEVPYLKGDSRKLRATGWEPRRNFRGLVKEMVESDIRRADSGVYKF